MVSPAPCAAPMQKCITGYLHHCFVSEGFSAAAGAHAHTICSTHRNVLCDRPDGHPSDLGPEGNFLLPWRNTLAAGCRVLSQARPRHQHMGQRAWPRCSRSLAQSQPFFVWERYDRISWFRSKVVFLYRRSLFLCSDPQSAGSVLHRSPYVSHCTQQRPVELPGDVGLGGHVVFRHLNLQVCM